MYLLDVVTGRGGVSKMKGWSRHQPWCVVCAMMFLGACQGELDHQVFQSGDVEVTAQDESPKNVDSGEVSLDMSTIPGVDSGAMNDVLPPVYGKSTVRLLTPVQYRNAISQLSPMELTQREVGSYNSSLAAASGGLNGGLVDAYSEEAFSIASQWFSTPESTLALMTCLPERADDTCTQDFLRRFGRLVWRRPLTDNEVARYVALSVDVSNRLQSPIKGVEYAVAGMLQSPYFIYRVELGTPSDTHRTFDAYEIATRLSFLLTNSPPSSALLDAARDGELEDREGLERHARALLNSPAGERGLRALGVELYGLDAIVEVEKDASLFPEFSEELAEAMREQVALTFVDHVVSGRDYRELFNRREVFMHPVLAELYGVHDLAEQEQGWQLYTFPEELNRQGILSLAGIMASHSGIANTSPTTRGFFVRTDVLCDVVPPPGPNVDTTLPIPEEGEVLTNRELLGRHVTEPSCSGCHSFMDPLGFPLENYDPIGRYRTHQNMLPIDASGSLDGTDFETAQGFSEALAANPKLIPCLNKKLFAYSFARLMQPEDEALMQDLNASFEGSSYDLREALVTLAVSDAMRFAAQDDDEDHQEDSEGGQP